MAGRQGQNHGGPGAPGFQPVTRGATNIPTAAHSSRSPSTSNSPPSPEISKRIGGRGATGEVTLVKPPYVDPVALGDPNCGVKADQENDITINHLHYGVFNQAGNPMIGNTEHPDGVSWHVSTLGGMFCDSDNPASRKFAEQVWAAREKITAIVVADQKARPPLPTRRIGGVMRSLGSDPRRDYGYLNMERTDTGFIVNNHRKPIGEVIF